MRCRFASPALAGMFLAAASAGEAAAQGNCRVYTASGPAYQTTSQGYFTSGYEHTAYAPAPAYTQATGYPGSYGPAPASYARAYAGYAPATTYARGYAGYGYRGGYAAGPWSPGR